LFFEIFHGPIFVMSMVFHFCDLCRCVNPNHLFLGDQLDNMGDMAAKMRGTTSAKGLPYGVSVDPRAKARPFQARVAIAGRLHRLGSFATAGKAGSAAIEFKRANRGL